jgi:HlyD family secretion protein
VGIESVRRFIVILVIVIAVGGGGYYLYTRAQSAQPARPNIRSVTIDRGDLTLAVTATGSVAALRSARVGFENPGVITEVFVTEGQRVLANQLLARQDATAYRLAMQQAEATLRGAKLSYDQLVQPPTAQDLAVAEANVKAAKDAYAAILASADPNAIRTAEIKLQQAQQAYADAQQRRRDAGGRYPLDSPQYQLALAQEGQASFGVEAARLQLDLARRGVDARIVNSAKARITLAESELARAKSGPPQFQVDQATLRIKQAETALEQAKQQLGTTELRAPFAGEITTLTLRVGGLSASNVPGAILTDRSQLNVNINVDEIDIGSVREGQSVTLTFDALSGDAFTGLVTRIAPNANPAAGTVVTYQVEVRLPPNAGRVKPGMTASASIIVQELKNALRVPNIFVRLDRRNNQAFVNLVGADGRLSEIPVTLGLRTDEYSEVVAGLGEGDVIGISLDSGLNLLGQ